MMMRSRFSEEQIIGILRGQGARAATGDVFRLALKVATG
jgi:hypothetical protein